MPWDFVLWILAMSLSSLVAGFVALILWGLWRELKKRK